MKRQQQGQRRGETDDQEFARAALAELRQVWQSDRPPRRRSDARRLRRLAAETRELLALWTYYRLACLEAMDGGHMGMA